MRISVQENDSGYSPHAHRCSVYLDGKRVEKCFTADEELGVCYCHDIEAFVPGTDEIPVKELRGEVEIKLWTPS